MRARKKELEINLKDNNWGRQFGHFAWNTKEFRSYKMGHAKWDMQSEIDLNNQRIKHIFMVGRIKMYSERKTRGDTFRFSLSKWARNY